MPSDESGMESPAGKSRRFRSRTVKGSRSQSPTKSRTIDGSGSGAGAGAGGLNSRDGRRTWTDAESDRLREVVEHGNGKDKPWAECTLHEMERVALLFSCTWYTAI